MRLEWQLEYQTNTDWPYTYVLSDGDNVWSPGLARITQFKRGKSKRWRYLLVAWGRPEQTQTFTSLKKAKAVGLAIVRLTN